MATEEESEGVKPALHKQFLRVQKEEEEDTWISGEELKTEGSSGSDEEVPRRKITNRKSRRRRSEGYTPPESRMSLPNISDNKTGISFHLSRPSDLTLSSEEHNKELRGERYSYGGEMIADKEDKDSKMRNIEAAMARMRTRSSLDKTCELEELEERIGSDWRPKRGSLKLPNLEEATSKFSSSKKNRPRNTETEETILPNLKKPKKLRFSDKVEEFDIEKVDKNSEKVSRKSFFYGNNLESDDYSSDFSEYNANDVFFGGDIDRELLRSSSNDTLELASIGRRLKDPKIVEENLDLSVKNFINDMNTFYKEMSGKLKSLKTCPVLDESEIPCQENYGLFMNQKHFKDSFKNLKNTPRVKKTLNFISKMDNDISETITQFREERAQRLEAQRNLIRGIPHNKDSQLFLQLCNFEMNNKNDVKDDSINRNETNYYKKGNNKRRYGNTNFIEINKELAKLGMNLSLSDEQKEKLERILEENRCAISEEDEGLSATETDNTTSIQNDDIYRTCEVNAYKLNNDQENRIIRINSALKIFEDEKHGGNSGASSEEGTVMSLKEIDEKLEALSVTYLRDKEILEKGRRRSEMDIDKIEEEFVQDIDNQISENSSL